MRIRLRLADRTFRIESRAEPNTTEQEAEFTYPVIITDELTETSRSSWYADPKKNPAAEYGFCDDLWDFYRVLTGQYAGDNPYEIIERKQ